MKIDLTKKEMFILLLLMTELVARCKDSESGLNYPKTNIEFFESLADKLENYAKIAEDENEDWTNWWRDWTYK